MTKLNEFDRLEWWDVVKVLKPGITEEEFAVMWDEFCRLKQLKETQ